MAETKPTVHGTAVLFGNRAVVLRGASGSGKSRLALELLAEGRRRGVHTALIGDDRVVLEPAGGRLLVRVAPTIAGRLEIRGLGIVHLDHEPAGVVGLVVDLVRECPDRLPDPETGEFTVELFGVVVPHLALWIEDPALAVHLCAALAALAPASRASWTNRSELRI